jgi:hypothetical protein
MISNNLSEKHLTKFFESLLAPGPVTKKLNNENLKVVYNIIQKNKQNFPLTMSRDFMQKIYVRLCDLDFETWKKKCFYK